MSSYISRADLKMAAKYKLTGKYRSAISLLLLAASINFFAANIVSYLIPVTSVLRMVFYLCFSFIISAVSGVMNFGIRFFFLKMACGQQYTVSDLFAGYRDQTNKVLAVTFIFTLINFVSMLPMQIFLPLYLQTGNSSYLLAFLIGSAIGLLIYVPVNLCISQSYYLILDFPNYKTKDILKGSLQVMKGHKARLFFLEISFLPMYLLCLFTLGIGFLWLNPYIRMTLTLFYLDIMNPSHKKAAKPNDEKDTL